MSFTVVLAECLRKVKNFIRDTFLPRTIPQIPRHSRQQHVRGGALHRIFFTPDGLYASRLDIVSLFSSADDCSDNMFVSMSCSGKVSHRTFCTIRFQKVVHMKIAIFNVVLVVAFANTVIFNFAVSSAGGGASQFDGQVVLKITFPFVCGSVGTRSPVTQLGTQ